MCPAHRTDTADSPTVGGDVPTVYTLDEAAVILRVRKGWLERQAAARKIPFTMLGGAYHFTSHHLMTILQLHEVTPSQQEYQQSEAVSAPRGARRRPEPPTYGVAPLRPRPRTGPRRAA